MFLPSPVYESLPAVYTAQGVLAIVASDYNTAVVGFSALLFTAAALIVRMRRRHRRNLGLLGLRQQSCP